jgi:hypothetical protein
MIVPRGCGRLKGTGIDAMDLYTFGRTVHISVGVITLVTFWIAALARKGSALHRRAGSSTCCRSSPFL